MRPYVESQFAATEYNGLHDLHGEEPDAEPSTDMKAQRSLIRVGVFANSARVTFSVHTYPFLRHRLLNSLIINH
jgi:hypothetical protein